MADRMKRLIGTIKRRKGAITAILLVIAVGAATAAFLGRKSDGGDYITTKVERGTVEVSVAATGTVSAVVTVQVGSQVSGTVSWLGADFKSHVKKGEVIAKLDPAIFQTAVDNGKANVTSAQAAVEAAQT